MGKMYREIGQYVVDNSGSVKVFCDDKTNSFINYDVFLLWVEDNGFVLDVAKGDICKEYSMYEGE